MDDKQFSDKLAEIRKKREEKENKEASERWEKFKSKQLEQPVKEEKDFKTDLKRGHKGEHDFFQKYQHVITHLDGRNADFEINKTGETVELKTDYYDKDTTGNFFMERYSHDNKAGGPWQSDNKNITYYIYRFAGCGTIYIFNTKQLVKKLSKMEHLMKLINVKNKGYITRGYKVPIGAIKDIALEPDEIGLHSK